MDPRSRTHGSSARFFIFVAPWDENPRKKKKKMDQILPYSLAIARGFVVGTVSGFGTGFLTDMVVVRVRPPQPGVVVTPGIGIGMVFGGVAGVLSELSLGYGFGGVGGVAVGFVGGILPLVFWT